MHIKDKVFVVTGAGSGLGAATARFVATDVTSDASARAAISTATAMGSLRGLVNCAGVAPAEKLLGREGVHSLESFARTININLIGSFNMIRLAAEAMSATPADEGGERGVIVNTASVAAFDGQLGQAAYAAPQRRSHPDGWRHPHGGGRGQRLR